VMWCGESADCHLRLFCAGGGWLVGDGVGWWGWDFLGAIILLLMIEII